jgi:hypothetical protein
MSPSLGHVQDSKYNGYLSWVICWESVATILKTCIEWQHLQEPKHENENENHEHENYYNRWIGSMFFACLFVWIWTCCTGTAGQRAFLDKVECAVVICKFWTNGVKVGFRAIFFLENSLKLMKWDFSAFFGWLLRVLYWNLVDRWQWWCHVSLWQFLLALDFVCSLSF